MMGAGKPLSVTVPCSIVWLRSTSRRAEKSSPIPDLVPWQLGPEIVLRQLLAAVLYGYHQDPLFLRKVDDAVSSDDVLTDGLILEVRQPPPAQGELTHL